MKNSTRLLTIAATLLFVVPALVSSADSGRPATLEGDIVDVRQGFAADGAGPFTEVRVRTQEREEQWVRLGRPEDLENAYRVGERIRARVMAASDGAEVRNAVRAQNMNTGRTDRFRGQDAARAGQRDRVRARDGSCSGNPSQVRRRDRVHSPGTGGGSGGGQRRGGR